MSKKQTSQPTEKPAKDSTPAENTKSTAPEKAADTPAARPVTRRYGKNGQRRGKYAYAAPLGVLITLLSLVGVAAIVFGGITLIGRQRTAAADALKEEMYYFLQPLMFYNPTPFEDVAETEQDAFLNAAAYRVSLAEQVRMLRENDENCAYPVDDQGRIAVPTEEIEASYRALFGPDAPLNHRTLSEDELVYSEADECYYVPFNTLGSSWRGVIDHIRHRGSVYTVRIGYVASNDILLDEHGNEIPPKASDATYYQTYTVVRYADGYYVKACQDQ